MSYLRRIQLGIDHIEDHLDIALDLRDVSLAAGISHWHFQRTFKALTGETLMTYVRSRRLARALEALLDPDRRIVEIALAAGFDSQEAFTRAFKRTFGMTPGEYRKLGERNRFVKKVRFDEDYLRHLGHNVSRQPEVARRGPMQLVGLRTLFYSVDSERNNIGEELPPLWAAFLPRLAEIEGRVPGVCYGVVRQAQDDSDLLEYHAAAPITGNADPPVGMVAVQLPAATWATFEHRGDPRRIDHTVNYVYSTWLARSGHAHTYGPDLEIYGAGWRAKSEDSVMHYAIPIG